MEEKLKTKILKIQSLHRPTITLIFLNFFEDVLLLIFRSSLNI